MEFLPVTFSIFSTNITISVEMPPPKKPKNGWSRFYQLLEKDNLDTIKTKKCKRPNITVILSTDDLLPGDASGSKSDGYGCKYDNSGSMYDASGSKSDGSGSNSEGYGSNADGSGSNTDSSGSKSDESGSMSGGSGSLLDTPACAKGTNLSAPCSSHKSDHVDTLDSRDDRLMHAVQTELNLNRSSAEQSEPPTEDTRSLRVKDEVIDLTTDHPGEFIQEVLGGHDLLTEEAQEEPSLLQDKLNHPEVSCLQHYPDVNTPMNLSIEKPIHVPLTLPLVTKPTAVSLTSSNNEQASSISELFTAGVQSQDTQKTPQNIQTNERQMTLQENNYIRYLHLSGFMNRPTLLKEFQNNFTCRAPNGVRSYPSPVFPQTFVTGSGQVAMSTEVHTVPASGQARGATRPTKSNHDGENGRSSPPPLLPLSHIQSHHGMHK